MLGKLFATTDATSPRFVGASFDAGGDEAEVDRPSGVQAGDLLVALISYQNGSFLRPPPSEFVYLSGNLSASYTNNRLLIAYKIAGVSEPSSYLFSHSNDASICVTMVAYRGANTVNIIGSTSYTASGSNTVAPSITPSSFGCLVGCFAKRVGESVVTPPVGMREISGVLNSRGSMYVYEESQTAPSATDTRSATWSGTSSGAAVLLQLTNETVPPSPVVSVASATTVSTSLTISKPANVQEGDLLVAYMVSGTSASWTGATDWVEVVDSTVRVAYKVATSSEPSSYTFTRSATGVAAAGTIVALRGVNYTRRGSVVSSVNGTTTSTLTVGPVSVDAPASYEMAFVADPTALITPLGTYQTTQVLVNRATGVSPSYILYAQEVTAAESYTSRGRSQTGSNTGQTRAVKLVFTPK
jgi:hypothetical protein